MPISCQFQYYKTLLVTSLTHVSSAVASFTFTITHADRQTDRQTDSRHLLLTKCHTTVRYIHRHRHWHRHRQMECSISTINNAAVVLSSSYCEWFHTVSQKNKTPNVCPHLHHILTDFQNTFTSTLCRKFAINGSLKIPSHLKGVLHYLVKY